MSLESELKMLPREKILPEDVLDLLKLDNIKTLIKQI